MAVNGRSVKMQLSNRYQTLDLFLHTAPIEFMTRQPADAPDATDTFLEKITALPANVRGALWVTAAGVLFMGVAVLVRLVGDRIPITEMLFVRQSVMLVLASPILIRQFPQSVTTRRFKFHFARSLLAFVTMWIGFTVLLHLPIADATALGFAKSFFLTIFAIIFLKETVGLRRWAATIVGFVGVLIMLRPTAGVISPYALMAVGGAATAALVMTIVRYLARQELPITLLYYQTVLVGLMALPFAIAEWVTPNREEWLLLLAIGGLSAVAQIMNIRAFRIGEAAFLAALDYSRLLWATLFGFLLFAERPSTATLLGAAVIIGAAIYTIRREARLGKVIPQEKASRAQIAP